MSFFFWWWVFEFQRGGTLLKGYAASVAQASPSDLALEPGFGVPPFLENSPKMAST
jgi:hypothetical protein